MSSTETTEVKPREGFSSRRVFIFAAIGSAVGLGNIWRFPYVAYEGGGGAFIIPYLCALLFAGIPLLYLDYAIGHRFRGSAPLSLRRLHRGAEWLGWWQVLICTVIAVYYAAILAWAAKYTLLSFTKGWGADPEAYFFGDYLQAAPEPGPTFDFVPGILITMVLVWVVTIGVLALGVQTGIGRTAVIFIPVLILAFIVLVAQALTLDGAMDGLNAFFTPDWGALTHGSVWISAVGQIFFSLSVGFGIMITYSSYVDRKTDMTGSGAVVGFSNSGFELLAGIGVFAALGFMAQAAGKEVSEVVANGIGLAFVAFPTIINEAPGGLVIGVLFFGALLLAGLTSLISIVEVVIGAVRDKVGISRRAATFVVGVPMAAVSILMFSTTGGIYVLDTMDAFVNSFGIIAVAAVMMLAVTYAFRKLGLLRAHLDARSSIKLKGWWPALIAVVIPLLLVVMLWQELTAKLDAPYEKYPADLLGVFGWGMVIALPILAILLSLLPWRGDVSLDDAPDVLVDGGENP
ncbi:sodium-dependent transporter [Janibacter terrae]|uniref:Sodium-dependent transporter n=1 Tax=Janibacter terrae TaxID=103817 RepID=A0ABZ2FE68_9MICO|nr:sodium-dependent transporter [Janibacter terrae]HBO54220.1 sodium-dependent transporter [Janibacter terrae]HCE61277.1 sodium-dependent transporter [Janibacter terrae]